MTSTGDGATIDIGPGARGANTLGTNDGAASARTRSPASRTRRSRPPRRLRARAHRVLGRRAELRDAARALEHGRERDLGLRRARAPDRRRGARVGRLEWDVKLYFALNGAVHDAAVAAWGVKGHYDSVRPISMIRYLGRARTGCLSSPDSSSWSRRRRAAASATRRWPGTSAKSRSAPGAASPVPADAPGVGWILARDWIPYQLPTFVTPAFAGYVSGHSTFSRAAAEVLTSSRAASTFPAVCSSGP